MKVAEPSARREKTPPGGGAPPVLTISNLRRTYRLGHVKVPVLRGVSLTIGKGECVAVLGASGSGKSTLLHLIAGLDRPDKAPSGTPAASILYNGRDLAKISSRALNDYRSRDVGLVFQFYHLFPELTVLENVVVSAMVARGWGGYLASRRGVKKRAAELLERVGLSHRLKHRPIELSGGERQRVAIARALINDPPLLLADEPTGNLDSATGGKILDLLDELRGQTGRTMILVTHDSATAARADRVVRLTDGLIAGEIGERSEKTGASTGASGGSP
jgi:lipoprotein-releasing system ATP-binding protein